MPYIGKQPATISAVSVDTDTGTFSGQVAAASLDISGNVDVDGVLETDGISIASTVITSTAAELNILDGVTASAADINLIDGITNGTVIASKAIITDANKDISGGRNITISGELDAATLDISGNADIDGTLEADAITVNGTALNTVIAGVTVANATLAATTTVTDSTANTNFPVVFHDESNALLDDTGALRYNPSTGELLVPKLTVAGVTTTADTVTMQAANAVVFEGATADAHETTLTITDPTADRTITLPNVSGTLPILAADSNTAITSTPAELNILDGATVVVGEINALDLGSTAVGTAIASKAVILDSNKDYTGIRNFTISGELDAGSLDISGDIDVDGTTNLDVVDIDGAVDMASTLTVTGVAILNGGIDIAGDFTLDVGGGDISIKDDGTTMMNIGIENSDVIFNAQVSDKDIIFKGNDGGSSITALTLDMSAAGNATFNQDIFVRNIYGASDGNTGIQWEGSDVLTFHTGGAENIQLTSNAIVFNQDSADMDFRIESNNNAPMFFVDAGNDRIGVGTDSPSHLLDVLKSGSGDAGVNIKSTTGGDPTLQFDSAAANRSGLIKFLDQGTHIGRIQYNHSDDSMDFQAGSSSGSTMSITNGVVTGTKFVGGGLGKVLQVVEATTTSTTTTSSDSFVQAQSVNITPSSTSSKVFITCSLSYNLGGTNTSGVFEFELRRDSSGIASTTATRSSGSIKRNASEFVKLDTPNTTSQVTYSINIKRSSGSDGLNYCEGGERSTMVAMEIAG